jgi:anti-sigma B factor antagonist
MPLIEQAKETVMARLPLGIGASTAVVTMPAEVEFANAPQVAQDLAAAFAPGVNTVIADFTQTDFCDSSGVREVILAYKRAASRGVAFRLVVRHPGVLTYLRRLGIATRLPVYPSLRKALQGGT